MIPNLLTIAGTDPSGGAGIQADIKTFSALGGYGMSVITAVVAQNTQGVKSFVALDADFVAQQIDAVFEDVRVDAVKIGMVANVDITRVVADRISYYKPRWVILDPVMVAKSGHKFLESQAIDAIRSLLIPIADLITPNLPEAAVLLDKEEKICATDMEAVAVQLKGLGASWVLLKGGHLDGPESPDVLCGNSTTEFFSSPRITTTNDHGTGCTLSAAITALLPYHSMKDAVRLAKDYLFNALINGSKLNVGAHGGHGPVHHFYKWWAC